MIENDNMGWRYMLMLRIGWHWTKLKYSLRSLVE